MKRWMRISLALSACLAVVALASCGGSGGTKHTPVVAIAVSSGSGQSATVSTAFGAPLVAKVTTDGTGTGGVTVTFTAPAAGASGTFGSGGVTETKTTDANGLATSSTFTANATSGAYNVTATATGASGNASFALTNKTGVAIAVSSGSGQNATISTAFAAPLVVLVTNGGAPSSGATVTFTAPATGASGTFQGGGASETQTTDANGLATSSTFTANAIAGNYNVAATVSGTATPANFALTNTGPTAFSFVFYASGEDFFNTQLNYYAIVGAITVDAAGNITGGEQDYNDANGLTSPAAGDAITGGALTVDANTGQGTLTLVTDNGSMGVSGTETFGIQFANPNHALIMQFDGTATSTGSMDLQTLPSTLSGGFAFTMSGVDSTYAPMAFGGMFSVSGTTISNGVLDGNDAGTVTTGDSFTGTISAVDSFGRGQITGITLGGMTFALNYYQVGPKVIRIIDSDELDAAVGSAYSQGVGSFNNASLGATVFSVVANPYQNQYGALGQFTTSNTGSATANFAGVADLDELDATTALLATAITGTYSIGSDGYGSLTINGGLGDVGTVGVYMVDPTLNVNDPNDATGGGGALVLDFAANNAGGTGALTPQTDSTAASFAGNYVAAWQDFNYFGSCNDCEFDMLSQGSVTSGDLSLTGMVSDPFSTLGLTNNLSTGDTFSGTPLADGSHQGRYSLLTDDSNSLNATIDGTSGTFDLVIYQASGGQLYWLEYDPSFFSVFTGSLEKQATPAVPFAKRTGGTKTAGRNKKR